MTHKETISNDFTLEEKKAKELIEKYLELDIEIGGQYDGYLTMKLHDAKQCTLIAVNEIIDQWELIDTYLADGQGKFNPNLKYWYKVKEYVEIF